MSTLNGKQVKNFTCGGERGSFVEPALGQIFMIVNEYHGTYDLDWLVVIVDGKEIERFNVQQLARIEWMPASAGG